MIVRYAGIFLKDLKSLPVNMRQAITLIVQKIEHAKSIREIPNCKKLQGVENAYRIRKGDYRLIFLFLVIDDTVFFQRVLPRGDIYKKHNLKK